MFEEYRVLSRHPGSEQTGRSLAVGGSGGRNEKPCVFPSSFLKGTREG